jgi:hypothetical protein
MLLDPAVPTVPEATTRTHAVPGDESYTEEYGETPESGRTLGGGVDFFSNMGTERVKKPRKEIPDSEKVNDLSALLPLNSLSSPSKS